MPNQGKRDFDAVAATWDEEPRRLMLAQEVVTAICRELPLAKEMEALDYGCGSGLVTLGLQPFVGRITAADSSQGMLQVLSRKVRERGMTNVVTRFIDLEQQRFEGSYDLIVSSMTLHHVDNVAGLIGSLVQMLKPGGWLALADLESEDGSFHEDSTGVYHRGFDREFFSSVCSDYLLTDIRILTAATIDKSKGPADRRLYPVLLCLARKQA